MGGNIATLLVARAIQGSVSGPTYMSTYVTRTTSTKLRSHYMQFIALAIGLGYGFGPFNGAALIGICNAANLDGKVFNARMPRLASGSRWRRRRGWQTVGRGRGGAAAPRRLTTTAARAARGSRGAT